MTTNQPTGELGTCDLDTAAHALNEFGTHKCRNWKAFTRPLTGTILDAATQPVTGAPQFVIGQVVWHTGYKRYMQILSLVYERLEDSPIHSYIVAAWNTNGTIQVFADKMRALTEEEVGRSAGARERAEKAAREIAHQLMVAYQPWMADIIERAWAGEGK